MDPIQAPSPQASSPPPPQPLAPIPKKNDLTLLWIVIVLIIGTAIGLLINNKSLISGFTIPGLTPTPTLAPIPTPSPTQDPTATWKTYTNYPPSYQIKLPNIDTSEGYEITVDGTSTQDGYEYSQNYSTSDSNHWLLIVAHPKTSQLPYRYTDWNIFSGNFIPQLNQIPIKGTKQIFDAKSNANYTFTRLNDIEVAGHNTTVFDSTYTMQNGAHSRYAVFQNGNMYYVITFEWTNPANETLFTQILSTFTFFEQTTIPTTQPTQGQFCGGIAGTPCPDGYTCNLQGNYPDASGTCVKNAQNNTYVCPPTGYVDCMPIMTPEKQAACSAEAMTWYKANCPDFKGGAL